MRLLQQKSATSVGKLVECPASHAMPWTRTNSAKAYGGTDKHEAVGALINNRLSGASEEAQELARRLRLPLDGVTDLEAEPAFVLDVAKSKVTHVGNDIGRDYSGKLGRPLERYEVPMSIDLMGMKNGIPWARDLKFGIYSDIWQLRVHGIALALMSDSLEVDVGFLFVDPSNAQVTEDAYTFFFPELDEWRRDIIGATNKAIELLDTPVLELPTIEGSWCQYCNALPHCPSKMKLVRSFASLEGLEDEFSAMTMEQKAIVWKRWRHYSTVLERIGDTIKSSVLTEPIVLGNGRVVRALPVKGYEYPDKKKTLALLEEYGIEDRWRDIAKKKADYERVTEVKE